MSVIERDTHMQCIERDTHMQCSVMQHTLLQSKSALETCDTATDMSSISIRIYSILSHISAPEIRDKATDMSSLSIHIYPHHIYRAFSHTYEHADMSSISIRI